MNRFWADLWQNVIVGVRLAFFLRADPASVRSTPEQLIAFVVLDLLLNLAMGFANHGPSGHLNLWALPRALLYFPFMLLAAYVVSRRERDAALLLAISIALISAALPLETVVRVAYDTFESTSSGESLLVRYAYYYAIVLWWAAIIGVTAYRFSTSAVPRRLASAGMAVMLIVTPGVMIAGGPQAELWTAAYRDEEARNGDDYNAAVREENFYAQPEILARELVAIKAQRKGVIDLYFVGFAGYASQDVFMKEMDSIVALFGERFDGKGRTVALVNSPKTINRYPIASRTSLARALKRIGKTIDREEDVVFLYMTSHGSERHQFAVEFWPLGLNNIDPPALKEMLDASGIKWRVIVISACYSGGFIEPLKDEYTLVLTAADATHQSFGCSNEEDFTYFGRAYFDQALRQSHSFIDGFATAKASIEAREKAEGKTPSNPQIHAGSEITKKLARLERRLAALGKAR